jgi:hypothetical protein
VRPTVFHYRTFNAAYAHAQYLKELGMKAALSPQPGTDRYRVRAVEVSS